MFDWLRKQTSSGAASSSPKELVFKSNLAAFEYACALLNSTENERPTLALVFSTHGNSASIKLANAQDNTIPTQHPREIEDLTNICLAAERLDKVPPLKKGDLVLFVVPKELASLGAGGADCWPYRGEGAADIQHRARRLDGRLRPLSRRRVNRAVDWSGWPVRPLP